MDVSDRLKELQGRPWLDIPYYSLGSARRVPTMLSRHEQLLYYWLGAVWARGIGEFVDVGSYVGGSTACLAEGHITANLPTRIHAFDRFTSSEALKRRMLYAAGIDPFGGEDILPLAKELLKPWAGRVTFHHGEITDQTWDGSPIEVLTLDASKVALKTDAMARMFLPAMVPGQSVLVQQDYLHCSQPWIAAQMELLADHFAPVGHCPDDSMVYLCTRQVDEEALERAEIGLLTDAEIFDLLDAARARHAGRGLDDRFDMMIRALEANPDKRIAWQFTPAPPPAE